MSEYINNRAKRQEELKRLIGELHDGKFIYIRYFAIRDENGEYQGTLEVSQDVTDIRNLEGEQRLLDDIG